MTTHDSSRLSRLPLFQGTFYNRRLLPPRRQAKPKISKLPGTPTWACRLLPQQPGWCPAFGFGLTPTLAYEDWKLKMTLWG